jgi:Tfp pilus assembly PilM family ATPase
MDTKIHKKISRIVLTGGGAQLKHIKQLVEYITGMDTNWISNEHLQVIQRKIFKSIIRHGSRFSDE